MALQPLVLLNLWFIYFLLANGTYWSLNAVVTAVVTAVVKQSENAMY